MFFFFFFFVLLRFPIASPIDPTDKKKKKKKKKTASQEGLPKAEERKEKCRERGFACPAEFSLQKFCSSAKYELHLLHSLFSSSRIHRFPFASASFTASVAVVVYLGEKFFLSLFVRGQLCLSTVFFAVSFPRQNVSIRTFCLAGWPSFFLCLFLPVFNGVCRRRDILSPLFLYPFLSPPSLLLLSSLPFSQFSPKWTALKWVCVCVCLPFWAQFRTQCIATELWNQSMRSALNWTGQRRNCTSEKNLTEHKGDLVNWLFIFAAAAAVFVFATADALFFWCTLCLSLSVLFLFFPFLPEPDRSPYPDNLSFPFTTKFSAPSASTSFFPPLSSSSSL